MNSAPTRSNLASEPALPATEASGNGLARKRELGQFFTPPIVAGFMWDLLEIIRGEAMPADQRVIDPACGDGVFLRVAHDRGTMPPQRLYGTDIDETLLSGWERDPLLRLARLHLANGLLDRPAVGIEEGSFDLVVGNPPFSGKGLRDLLRLLEEMPDETRHEEQDLFTANCLKEEAAVTRQALSRQERADLESLLRALSRYSCWRLGEGADDDEVTEAASERAPTELFAASALLDRRCPTQSDFERAAHLIANWPLNRPLDFARPELRDTVRRLASIAIEVVFTERFVRLAKPGGLIAIIVPESIVASDRLGAFRIWLLGRMDLLASISLPQKVFTGVGANAKTTIVFAQRRAQDRPDGWYSLDALDRLPGGDAPVFLAAPRLDAPDWSLERYLDRVLEDARKGRKEFWPHLE
jgi:hypothetical protein